MCELVEGTPSRVASISHRIFSSLNTVTFAFHYLEHRPTWAISADFLELALITKRHLLR